MKQRLFTDKEMDCILSPILTKEQIKAISDRTPKEEIEIKTDKSGFTYKSVKASYIKRKMIEVFGWDFDFKVLDREFIASTKEVIVLGRLTIRLNGGLKIVREQFGQFYLNTESNKSGTIRSNYATDIGNGYKAAASDSFKKCASELGVCWDIYQTEMPEQQKKESDEQDHKSLKKHERLEHFLENAVCQEEIEEIYEKWLTTAKEDKYSKKLLEKHIKRVLK